MCRSGGQRVRNPGRANPEMWGKRHWGYVGTWKSNELWSDGEGVKWREASKLKLLSPQLCGCNFPFFTVTLTQAVHMKTLYLWAWNALWRQKGFPLRPRGPFSTAAAHVNRAKSARSLSSNCKIALRLRTSLWVKGAPFYGEAGVHWCRPVWRLFPSQTLTLLWSWWAVRSVFCCAQQRRDL